MTKKIVFTMLTVWCALQLSMAQQFLTPFYTFSDDKISYVTLKDGKEIQGNIKDLDRKKGLIKKVEIKDLDGKKLKLKPEDISHMYLPPSGLSKLVATMDFLHDAQKWDNKDLNADIIGKGYVYFEQSDVLIKKKKRTMLMQLLNPSFSSVVKVYHDPFAKETASFGVAGVTLAGGHDKSYYIKKDNVAYLLKKKDYDEEFDLLFKSCPAVKEKFAKVKWSEFANHVFEASQACKK